MTLWAMVPRTAACGDTDTTLCKPKPQSDRQIAAASGYRRVVHLCHPSPGLHLHQLHGSLAASSILAAPSFVYMNMGRMYATMLSGGKNRLPISSPACMARPG